MKTPNKKIAVITKYFHPVAAGIETNIMETYTVLVERGFEVNVYTTRGTLTDQNAFALGDEVIRGLVVKRYSAFRFFLALPIKWNEYDIMALHNCNIMPHFLFMFRALLAQTFGFKKYALILTPHGGFNPEWSIFPRYQSWIKMFLQYTIGVFLINNATDGIRAVSEWEKEEMVKKGLREDKIAVIDNGIEDEAYEDVDARASETIKNKVAELGEYIIQIGRIFPIKNYETTIKALPAAPPHLNFVIVGPVGDNAYLQELKDLAERIGVRERVVFLGVVRGIDKYYLIKHARMMVHMALWESFCNVVHEGLSQGLVCIVANNTALPLLVKDGVNGFCLPTKDHEALAKKIRFVEDNRDGPDLVAMRERNRAYGLENSWRKVAARMEGWYTKLMSEQTI